MDKPDLKRCSVNPDAAFGAQAERTQSRVASLHTQEALRRAAELEGQIRS